jgi:hypothetical protein
MRRLLFLALSASSIVVANDGGPDARPEALPEGNMEVTAEVCTNRVPGWQAELRRIEQAMYQAKSTYDKTPSKANEDNILAAVEAYSDALFKLGHIEWQCQALMKSSEKTFDAQPLILPDGSVEITADIFANSMPGWQAEYRRVEQTLVQAKSTYDTAPSKDNETSLSAAVKASDDAIFKLGQIESRCEALMGPDESPRQGTAIELLVRLKK